MGLTDPFGKQDPALADAIANPHPQQLDVYDCLAGVNVETPDATGKTPMTVHELVKRRLEGQQ